MNTFLSPDAPRTRRYTFRFVSEIQQMRVERRFFLSIRLSGDIAAYRYTRKVSDHPLGFSAIPNMHPLRLVCSFRFVHLGSASYSILCYTSDGSSIFPELTYRHSLLVGSFHPLCTPAPRERLFSNPFSPVGRISRSYPAINAIVTRKSALARGLRFSLLERGRVSGNAESPTVRRHETKRNETRICLAFTFIRHETV